MLCFQGAPRTNPNQTNLSQVSTARKRLVRLMQRLCFGTIHDLFVHAGDPVLDPPPRIVRRRKAGGSNGPRPEADSSDFTLKREWLDFFGDLDAIGDGRILVIEVSHGLPFIYEFEDMIEV